MKKRAVSMLMCLCLIVVLLPSITEKAFALYPDEQKWVASGNPYGYNWIVSDDNYEVACTTIAWQSAYDNYGVSLPNWGNGGSWWDAAGAYSRGYSPAVGAIACWSYNDTPGTGHVAYVTAVNGPDSFRIYEGGRSGAYGYDHGVGSRTITRQGGPWPDQGFIYVGSQPQTSVSLTPWEGNETYIRETDASVGMTVSVTNGTPSFVGMVLYNASGAEVARGGDYGDWIGVWYFKINEELGYTLTPGTTYRYKFYAIVNGQTYWSSEQSFKTTGTAPSAVSASFAIGSQYSVGGTNASLATRLTLSGAVMTQVSRIGVYLYDVSGKQLAYIDENAGIDQNYNYLDIWYDVNSELHYTLTSGTDYKYKFFAVINGKTFWSDEWSFKTSGSVPISYSISLNRTNLDLTVGDSTTLTATVSPTGTSVTWSSSNTSVVTVSGGKVTAVGAGTATITAKAGDKTATCAVTVSEKKVVVTGMTLSQSSLALKQGDTATLAATVNPSNATDKTVTWSSSNPSVATVSGGRVTAVAEGTATITARAGSVEATCLVTVSGKTISVTDVFLNQTSLSIKVGDSTTLYASVNPSNATDKTVTWSSSNPSVATVSEGRVTAIAAGTATITAAAGGKTASCVVTVTEKTETPKILTSSLSPASIGTKYTATLTASGSSPITWSISSGSLPPGLSLSSEGMINGTPTKAGTYSFTVSAKNSAGNATSSFTLSVNEQKQQGAEVHFERVTIYYQDQFTDVPADQWYTESVANAFELGLMKGNSADTFNPYGDVTVAEAITMAARIHSIYSTGTENFDQSVGGAWYQTYLDYALANGIISRAYYNSDVTHKASRAQFAEIFANSLPAEALAAMNSVADNAIPDVKMTDSFAAFVYKLYRAGILTGSDANGTFNPQTFITRAEAAAIVSRMAESNNRVSITLN